MPIDSSIVSRLIPAQIQQTDPMERYGKSLALQNLMRQGDLQGVQYDEAVRGADANRRIAALFSSNPKATSADVMGIDPTRGLALRKAEGEEAVSRSTIAKNDAAAGKSKFDVDMEKLSRGAALLNEARDPQSFANVLRVGAITGTFAPEAVAKMQELGYSPENVKSLQAAGITRAKQLEDERARATQAETGRHNLQTEKTAAGQLGVAQGNLGLSRSRLEFDKKRADDSAADGKIPPGYRKTATGLEAIPGGPADIKEEKVTGERKRALDMYVAARDGLLSGLEQTSTGALAGRIAPWTTGQQIAEGGVAAMAPVLKQLFRVAGEGVFTDKDQQLLLDMVPKRTDNPDARGEKMSNIDRIVAAKLGAPVPERVLKNTAAGKVAPAQSSVRSQADAILGKTP